MPNPRFISTEGIPTVELLEKIRHAKLVFNGNLEWFCEKWYAPREGMEVEKCYLIGSHANDFGWHDETSDLDLKLIMPRGDSEKLRRFRKEVLGPLLCNSERKRDWIDLYFVQRDDQVLSPRYDVTQYWEKY